MTYAETNKTNTYDYASHAKAAWGDTAAYKEYEERFRGRTESESQEITQGLTDIFARFGSIRNGDPASEEAQNLVKDLQDYITEHYYTCTKEILKGLGSMYAAGGEFTANIDSYGGEGTAEFVHQAIEIYCG